MEKEPSRENRRYPRIETPFGIWVSWGIGESTNVSRVSDFNEGGMFIATPAAPPVGTTIKVLMVVQEGEIRAMAVVRNMSPAKGMGIEFVSISAQDKLCLNKLVKRLLDTKGK
jgi:hypothetical protein